MHYLKPTIKAEPLIWKWYACILIQDTTSILFDPVINNKISNDIPRYSFDDLPDNIDYIVITHSHIKSNKFVDMCRTKGVESEKLFGQKEWLIDAESSY